MPAGVLADPLATPVPVTFLAPARAIENQAAVDPHGVAALRQAIAEGWADVAGGAYTEADEPSCRSSRSSGSSARGGEVYREHLDDRNVETFARRRFGLFRNCRRSPSASGSGSRSTSASTPAGSRSVPSRSGSGRAPTGPVSRP